jgi:hypothetical protein
MANYKAQFKTALGQHEIVLDCKVSADMVVGQVCKYTAATNTLAASTAEAVAGDYIIAQSDMTMEYGHVPVENRDYRYSPKVAASTAVKKVAVFKVTDVGDVYSYTI